MLNNITIARRASLGRNLIESHSSALERLRVAAEYFELIETSLSLNEKYDDFHRANYLIGIVSIMEVYLTNVICEFLVCFPGHLEDKGFKLDELSRSGSTLSLIEQSANKFVHQLTYMPVMEAVEISLNKFNNSAKIDDSLVGNISEIKSVKSRPDVYQQKSGGVYHLWSAKGYQWCGGDDQRWLRG